MRVFDFRSLLLARHAQYVVLIHFPRRFRNEASEPCAVDEHSFVDFNLQIAANSAWFYVPAVLAASPYAVETRQRVRRMRSRNETDSPVSQTRRHDLTQRVMAGT
jgi:hypothetical protein